jgi:choline kinase
MEELVIEHVRKLRDDVVFVRNPLFQTTSNAHSLWLATRDLQEPFIAIDGDMLINPLSFKAFLNACTGRESIIGVAKSKTEEAVFVRLDILDQVVAFHREPRETYEWCGIAYLKNIRLQGGEQAYVYSVLEKHLPLRSKIVDCYEIDTPADLDYALRNFSGMFNLDCDEIEDLGSPTQVANSEQEQLRVSLQAQV